jgi:hypothetical protein
VATAWLKAGAWPVRCRLGSRTAERLHDLCFEFWDDEDFLSLSQLQDLTPAHARRVRELMRWSDETIQEMEEVLTRWRVSAAVLTNLEGLLTAREIQGYGRLLMQQPGGGWE